MITVHDLEHTYEFSARVFGTEVITEERKPQGAKIWSVKNESSCRW